MEKNEWAALVLDLSDAEMSLWERMLSIYATRGYDSDNAAYSADKAILKRRERMR